MACQVRTPCELMLIAIPEVYVQRLLLIIFSFPLSVARPKRKESSANWRKRFQLSVALEKRSIDPQKPTDVSLCLGLVQSPRH